MIIRPATPADVPRLIDILNQIIEIGGTTAYQDPLDAGYLDRFFTGNSKTFLHVAENVDGIQGMQWMDALDPPNDHIGGIATFADPTTTQRGVGTALFDITRAASLAAGYSELYAKIRADNTGGLAYYEKMGFRDHLVDRAVPLKDGTPVNRITKRLKLDPSH